VCHCRPPLASVTYFLRCAAAAWWANWLVGIDTIVRFHRLRMAESSLEQNEFRVLPRNRDTGSAAIVASEGRQPGVNRGSTRTPSLK
jgi:hypothetical protein